ncbi:MAG TPA: hypothetical protein VF087_00010 [Solirubrobacteraceae bacterium]
MSSWSQIEAKKAFRSASRARRRATLTRRLRGHAAACGRLAVHDETVLGAASEAAGLGRREIPLEAINATLEPNRAEHFDRDFRPAGPVRSRWQSVWMAEHRGTLLPPIAVVRVGDAYAIRDGHHRVSVARARGAVTIDAIVSAA